MKRLCVFAGVALVLAASAYSQTPAPKPSPTPSPAKAEAPSGPDFKDVDVSVGGIQRDVDTGSSKFFEYRDIPQGGVVPLLRFRGKNGDLRWDFRATDVTQKDQTYFL